MIRKAKSQDIPAITALMVEGYERSKYRDIDTIDVKEAKALIFNAIQRHGLKKEGGCCVFVIDRDGIQGFCVGALERLLNVGTRLKARDLFTYVRPGTHGLESIKLVSAYLNWAKEIPNLALVGFDPTDILGDKERIAKFFGLFGFKEMGVMMEMAS